MDITARLEATPEYLQKIEEAVIAMERRGFCLDSSYCLVQAAKARAAEARVLGELAVECARLGIPPLPGVDLVWSSPKQMVALLHGCLGLPPSPVKKKGKVDVAKGERSTDETALGWICLRAPFARPLLSRMIELRRIRNCIKYLEKLPTFVAPDGRVHPICGPDSDEDDRVGAVTGRNAMKKPEGQQFPNDPEKDPFGVRGAIVAPPGRKLIVIDYTALEVVLLAHIIKMLFGDDQLAKMVSPGAPDIHSVNARAVFGTHLGWTLKDGRSVADLPLDAFVNDKEAKKLRKLIKAIWYGLMYGKGAYGFGTSLTDDNGDPIGEEKAGDIVEALLNAIPGIRRYQDWVRQYIKKHKGIPSLLGRWCPLAALIAEGTNKAFNRAWRRALNFPMQGGGADVIGLAMVLVEACEALRLLGWGIVLQVHDELVLEGPEETGLTALSLVTTILTNVGERLGLTVPLQVKGTIVSVYSEGK